ncbi:hypothetical protein M501DRAFT_375802 [Patellaria atrata CBS 101060]|uniref:Uncharacterized protein n=1 Tax=Patellaria atrata CBS 101060 TaxID=1346257 RepID=A0A9P4VUI5_9PEZI|nr:hypothetical protein M501DRAFT_375802 [Patellaria atrata CBS 101060]
MYGVARVDEIVGVDSVELGIIYLFHQDTRDADYKSIISIRKLECGSVCVKSKEKYPTEVKIWEIWQGGCWFLAEFGPLWPKTWAKPPPSTFFGGRSKQNIKRNTKQSAVTPWLSWWSQPHKLATRKPSFCPATLQPERLLRS